MSAQAGITLFWLPLGAGGHSVRWNGRIYEAACALLERRTAVDLYHSALQVSLPPDAWVVEMTPVWADRSGGARGVVAEAVGSPTRLSTDERTCRRLLATLPSVPTPVWGRDELGTGEMWNSNSVTAWSLARSGLDPLAVGPPAGGRAPGWSAGVVAARRLPPAAATPTEQGRRPEQLDR